MKKSRIYIRDFLENILFNNGKFCRIDIPIRVMAVESYHQHKRINNIWWRMQFSKLWYRWGKSETRTVDYSTTILIQKRRLTDMVDSFSNRTFPNMPLIVGSNYALKDGSHRIACHIYFDSEFVSVEFLDKPNFKPIGIDNLLMEHYTPEESELIMEYKDNILRKYDLI